MHYPDDCLERLKKITKICQHSQCFDPDSIQAPSDYKSRALYQRTRLERFCNEGKKEQRNIFKKYNRVQYTLLVAFRTHSPHSGLPVTRADAPSQNPLRVPFLWFLPTPNFLLFPSVFLTSPLSNTVSFFFLPLLHLPFQHPPSIIYT